MRVFGYCVICKRPKLVDVTASDVRRAEERREKVVQGVCSSCEMNKK